MFHRKQISYKEHKSRQQGHYEELLKYSNPDFLSNCISYAVNSIWFIHDKNSGTTSTMSEVEFIKWQNSVLYDDF